MRLLFYLERYPGWGGIETVTSLIVDELLNRGYKIDIISFSQQPEAQPIPQEVNLYRMPSGTLWDTEENLKYAMRIADDGAYDLIIYQDSYAPCETLLVELSKMKGIPFIVFEHNTPLLLLKTKFVDPINTAKGVIKRLFYPYFRRKYLKRERIRKRYIYDNCLRYVMLSKNYIPEISKRLGIATPANKFRYINNPVPYKESKTDLAKNNEILFVGRLVKEKRVDKILNIWHKIQDSHPGYSLSIVGDGPERNELEEQVKAKGIHRVTFYGYQSPVEFYQRSRFFLMTSEFEGWGMTLLECMSQGCIPLAENNFSALTDIIDDDINGFVLPANASISRWKTCLNEIMKNPEKISSMANSAKSKMLDFSISNIADKWESLFTEALNN